MLIFSTATADRHPVVVDDVTYFKSEWMKAGDDPAFSPTVFLVEQPSESPRILRRPVGLSQTAVAV